MKKLLTLTLIFSFTLLYAGNSRAAVHNFTGDFDSYYLMKDYNSYSIPFEGWYYIDKDEPSATVRGTFTDSYTAFGAEYFKNDQTFVNLTYYKIDYNIDFFDDPFIYLKGSYLFANNFFIGLDTGKHGDYYSQVNFSPGYRFNFANNAGYLAASVDYAANDDNYYSDSGVIDYEINGRYYTNKSRLYGQLIIPSKDALEYDASYLKVGGAYQCSNHITIGAIFDKVTDYYTYFEFGCSTAFDRLGAEFRFGNCIFDENGAADYTDIEFNVLYSCTDHLRAGCQYYKNSEVDDPELSLKAKYAIDDQNAIMCMQELENDTYDATTFLYWDIKLK